MGLHRRAAGEGGDARLELGQREGFDQVVVAAGLQSLDAVGDGRHGGQEQHRRAHIRGAQGADHVQAVQLGQHAIDDQDIEDVATGAGQSGLAIAGHGDVAIALADAVAHIVRCLRIVFDDKNAHGGSQNPSGREYFPDPA